MDRVLSEYVHFVNHKGWEKSFEEFLKRTAAKNRISAFLQNVDLSRFGFIGFVEDFDADMKKSGDLVGTNFPFRKVNRGDYTSFDGDKFFDATKRRMIVAQNQQDIALYDELRRMRDR